MDWIDRYTGRLFQPIVIWLCQRFPLTQTRIYRYGWMIAGMMIFARAVGNGVSWPWMVFTGLMTVSLIVLAALFADMPGPNPDAPFTRLLRHMFVVLAVMHISIHVLILISGGGSTHYTNLTDFSDFFILLAEYALTVKTIPPRKAKEKKQAATPALEGV